MKNLKNKNGIINRKLKQTSKNDVSEKNTRIQNNMKQGLSKRKRVQKVNPKSDEDIKKDKEDLKSNTSAKLVGAPMRELRNTGRHIKTLAFRVTC